MSEESENFEELFDRVFDFFTEDPSTQRKLQRLRARIRDLQHENARLRLLLNPPPAPARIQPVRDVWAVDAPVSVADDEPPAAPVPLERAALPVRFACRICSELTNEDELVREQLGFRCATCPSEPIEEQEPIRDGKYR